MLTKKRLQGVYRDAKIIPYNSDSKFILMSDCHRGQGNNGDNFLPNQNIFFGALEYYYQNGFTYIELGDGDELWENRKMEVIKEVHEDEFGLMSRFYNENRFYMIYGNHDIVKSRKSYMQRHCNSYYCPVSKRHKQFFPGIDISEGLLLKNTDTKDEIFLVHGHQGDFINDQIWPVSRFLVRYLWGPLELIGFTAPTGAGRANRKKDKLEKRLIEYANSEKRILIAGHTHRPVFRSPNNRFYYNDGSCVHPRCITGIEIENNQLTLIKWHVGTHKDRSLFIQREVLEGPVSISEVYKNN